MGCTPLTQGYNYLGCDVGTSGIKSIGVTERANLDDTNVAKYALTSGVITTLVLATGKRFWKLALDKEMSSATDNGIRNVETKTKYYTPEIAFKINGLDALLKAEFDKQLTNNLLVIVEYRNGTFRLFGLDGGMDLTEITDESGTKFEDMNGYNAKLVGKSGDFARYINPALITAQYSPAP